jgi:UDP-glucose 4-epimerase
MLLNPPNILVTGAKGYVGAHICKALSLNGYNVYGFDDESTGANDISAWAKAIKGSITNYSDIAQAIKTSNADAIIHLAAKVSVPESFESPDFYKEQNVEGTNIILQAMKDFKVKKLIFSSTAAVYGNIHEPPISENAAPAPINPYGETKLAAEKYIEQAAISHDLSYFIMRFFNAVGCDKDGEIGYPVNAKSLIPAVMRALQDKDSCFEIYGTDHGTPDGSAVRDMIHVEDLASAHILATKALLDGTESNHILNLGTGKGYSVLEIIRTAEKISGNTLRFAEKERRKGDPSVSVASAHKALDILGWKAQYKDIDGAILHSWSWLNRKNK